MKTKDFTVVLFDIDGTLLDMRGAGRKSFVCALESVFGWRDEIAYVNFAGNTDLNVLQQVAAHHQTTLKDDQVRRFFAQVPLELEQTAREADLIIYPGVRELLEILSAREQVLLGLVTGNIAACARVKLRQFDLHNHFVLGAFGDEYADRNRIAQHALEKVQRHLGSADSIRSLFLIGDTPYDIAAARSIGAVAIAVATGKYDSATLRAAGADHVLPNLADTAAVLRLLNI